MKENKTGFDGTCDTCIIAHTSGMTKLDCELFHILTKACKTQLEKADQK